MEATTGLNMTVIGILTVFLALTLLTVVVTILARVMMRNERKAVPAPAATAAADAPDDERLRQVALAAYGFHNLLRRRRLVTASGPPVVSSWLQAGRTEQATCLPSRG